MTKEKHFNDIKVEIVDDNETYAKFLTDGAVELYYDNSKKLETDTAGVNITGTLDLSSHLDMPDSANIKLGDSDDLQIYHDGSSSYVSDGGTGSLYLRGTNIIMDSATGEKYIDLVADGDVKLYYDNSAKLATTAGGVLVTGELEATTLDINGTATIDANAGIALQVTQSGAAVNALRVIGSDGSFTGNVLQPWTVRAAGTAFDLIECVTNNGSEVPFRVRGDGQLTTAGTILIPNGTMAAPSLTFTNDTNTGITNNGALNNFYVSINGTMRIAVGSVIQFGCDGSAGTAALSFNGDWDTGIFHPTGDNLAITTAGTERMRFINTADVVIGTTTVTNDGPSTANSRLRVYRSGVCNGNIAHSTMGHFFASQSDDNTDGFEVYQQHGSNTTRNSFTSR